MRVKGFDGTWGPVFRTVIDVVQLRQVNVIAGEYFWDTDPGVGNGTTMLAFDGNFNGALEQVNASATAPSSGLHKLSVRVKGFDGTWGPVFRRVIDVVQLRQVNVIAGEYFWDTDPGAGNGTTMLAFDGNFNSAFEQVSASVSTANLSVGAHVLYVRAKGTDTVWGPAFRTVVVVDPQPEVVVTFDLRVALQGCMGTTSMNDPLRAAGLIPLTEPYSALGYDLDLNAGASTTSAVLNLTFPPTRSVVDWVLVEFHPALAPWQITASVPLLLRRGGSVSTTDGTYPFLLGLPAASYYVVVRHRNHLPVASAAPVAFNVNGATVAINFTFAGNTAYGSNSTVLTGSLYCLWAGDVNRDGLLKYVGSGNDRDPLLQAIGGTVPTNTINGYRIEDVNMDGSVRYVGSGNDRDPILLNIGGTVPTNVRNAQLP